MSKALIIGGNSGIGLAISQLLLKRGYEFVYIVGKDEIKESDITLISKEKFYNSSKFYRQNLINANFSVFDEINDIDTLVFTAGFGRVSKFDNLLDCEIENLVKCNMLSFMRIIKKYYNKLNSNNNFYCAVMGSIAGHISSPLFSVYGATKSGLCSFVENINVELIHSGSKNRILDVSPGSISGTNFNGKGNNLSVVENLAELIISKMIDREMIYIPEYDEIYKNIIDKSYKNPYSFGLESMEYKIKNNRINDKPQVVIGYLSGTFDLFHIGHLNLLRKAKQECDYLIVGVHKSGAWKGKETFIPFEERVQIVSSIKYVDKVIESMPEDSDVFDIFHYNKLFVGDDYKGSERFKKYEEFFKEKNVQIVYFPYTKGTSSTQLRDKLKK